MTPHHTQQTDAHICVVMVNFRTGHLLRASLERLAKARIAFPNLSVVVVDNASPDDSIAVMTSTIAALQCEAWVELLPHSQNAGFAAGNNLGVLHACTRHSPAPDYFFFLNPDAYVQEGCLQKLWEFSVQHHHSALLGAMLTDESGTPRPSGFRFPSLVSEFQRGAHLGIVDRLFPNQRIAIEPQHLPHRSDWVTGAAFWVPKKIWDHLGGMDDHYFLYFEEVDFMRHVFLAGFDIWTVPAARVVHLAGAATQIVAGKSLNKKMPAYWYESWRRYHFGNHGAASGFARGCAWLAGVMLNKILAVFVPWRRQDDGHRVRDFLRHGMRLTQE